jgi:hypothetical protein
VITDLEASLDHLKRFAVGHVPAATGSASEIPPYDQSLLSQAKGGQIAARSSEAVSDPTPESGNQPQVLEQWKAANLIDGLIATPDVGPGHTSFGWSSNAAPTADTPQWVAFQLPGDAPTVIDSAVVDTRTRDPWGMMRGAREIEISTSIEAKEEGPWKSLGRWELPLEPEPHLLRFPSAEARWVRLTVLSNHGSDRYVQLGEFGVHRLWPDVDPLGGLTLEFENLLTNLKRYKEGALGPGVVGP